MAGISGYAKRYPLTTVKKFSFTANNAAWKAKRQQSNESFYASQQTTLNMFNANVSFAAGQVQLTTQLVNQRLQNELNTRADERTAQLDALTARLDKTV